ncbi:hypothetical protein AMTR_s00047p00183800 [Amborella trichopoda]|uniref:Uncharacterized protein n=1 Tax=Amborella trichopoda TaxID=13333 RepID=U5D6F2_AMBTC|nr:hypothetical protein AMTR_s00047p00183800 [Amborella trichopoda]
MSSPKFPHRLSISLNSEFTVAFEGCEDYDIDIPSTIIEGESSQKHPTTFRVVDIASSSEEEPEKEVLEAALEAGFMKGHKSRDIISLRELVMRLRREAEHHQNMSDFY